MATRIERAKQADDEPEGAFREPDDRFSGAPWDKADIDAYLEVTEQLCCRAERYAQASNELRGRTQGVALSHIGRNGRGGSPDLIGQTEVPTQRFLKRQRISRAGQSPTALPCFQCFELLHKSKMDAQAARWATRFLLHQDKSPRITFPIPHSPVPVSRA